MRSLTLIALLPMERALVVGGFAMPVSKGNVAGDNCKVLKEGELLLRFQRKYWQSFFMILRQSLKETEKSF